MHGLLKCAVIAQVLLVMALLFVGGVYWSAPILAALISAPLILSYFLVVAVAGKPTELQIIQMQILYLLEDGQTRKYYLYTSVAARFLRPLKQALRCNQGLVNQLKGSLILLGFLALLFSAPIAAVGYSVHGYDLAVLAALSVVALVFVGPLAFFFATSLVSTTELVVILVIGACLFLHWLNLIIRKPANYLPYYPVTGWALMGAYFCVSLYFAHAAT